jgi:[ribosomal protein S5]-alanine N-acetyltransferase
MVSTCGHPAGSELQRLRADHAPAVLAFELANRAYFARSVADRGDEFFEEFAERYDARLAEQQAGTCIFHVLVAEDGEVLGRFNLVDLEGGVADLGYRVAEHVAGRGVATATVRELCRIAATQYGIRMLRAGTTEDNVASQRVLAKAGFVPVAPAHFGGRAGTWYQLDLAAILRSWSSSPPSWQRSREWWQSH